jgi:phospholipid-translocating ATPase
MDPIQIQYFCSNRVKRTKYTMVNFLIKNIFEQFHGAANFYFLGLAIMQTIPPFKEVDVIVTIMPLLIIFGTTAIKVHFLLM